ncbi:acylneuraminate cytidylyltransferase family protein [Flavivirga algicola]|uniref:Acylneuraminate cytidylyltransferase family protein n=1 Tax=Flavivirga algicola TaxID=2729136 RepID=A0ABX1RTL2_9FLAO|nr:acylneuraminate cytidylyltransferase family protein [Flavivirga algicola]NMH86345.1 acylneuraminate cytidylyltransferase family protein [Flavivirga algicola]
MKNIVIIPARGNSKRLLKKNILQLQNKPLITYSIEYAINNNSLVDEIYVSTDDEEIKEIALGLKVKVIDRPKELSGDLATTVSALKHVLENLDTTFDNVILLQPTNPLRPQTLLKEAYLKFVESDSDSLMTVSLSTKKLGKITNDNFEPYNYTMGQRSQDLEPLYFENGLLYITKTSLILDDIILGKNNYPFIINHPYAKVDIDTKNDFKYAEFILKNHPND